MLKIVAGAITGSIAIITEAIHSSIDLLASVVAFFSVRKADEPADEGHPYGHEKVENVAAGIEGMLILVGAGIIIFESVRRLVDPPEVESLGIGIAVIAFSGVANLVVSSYLYRQARATDSPALEGDAAHLRTDAVTSFGVLVALVLVEIDRDRGARPDHGPDRGGRDRGRRHPDPHPLDARARRRGPAGRGARRHPGRDRASTRPARSSASTSCAPAAPAAAATSTSTCSSATAPPCAAPTRSPTSCRARSAPACAARTC